MDWIFNALPFLIFLFVVVSVIRGAAKVVRKMGEQQEATRRPAAFDPGEAQRTRRIQEEIRRKIAERRGLAPALEPPVMAEETIEPPSLVPAAAPVEAPANASMAAILERQQQLADQMRELEEARVLQQRRAAAVAAARQEETDQSAATGAMRGSLLEDLRKAPTARRAILLREILDRPVGLR